MTGWLDRRVQEVRTLQRANEEGSLWLLFLDRQEGDVLVSAAISNAMEHLDALLVHNVLVILGHLPSAPVLMAIPRLDGHPREVDRRLWRDLHNHQFSGRAMASQLVDLVVVGKHRYWSARRETVGSTGAAT